MMISPESYIESVKNKSYDDLLKERDSLIKEILNFEKDEYQTDFEYVSCPSPDVIYQVNLQYLGKLCELISDVYNRDIKINSSKKTDSSNLLDHIDKLHSTEAGIQRIKTNLELDTEDVVTWCKQKIQQKNAIISSKGKNWYILVGGCKITVNITKYTIITAHKEK